SEPARVGRVGDDVDALARRAPTDVEVGDVVRRDEDPIGQGRVPSPAVVEPGQLVMIETAVPEVDRAELRRELGLAVKDLDLLKDVAVDQAEDDGYAELTAPRQGELRADVAEREEHLGADSVDLASQESVEVTGPPPGHARPESRGPVLQREGHVEAPGRSHPL